MALNDAALVVGANAIDTAITHFQLYSAATNAAGTTNAIGSRVAVNGTVDGDGDITWTNAAFTGLTANQAVHSVGYWSASTAGTFYGVSVLSGDATANSAGEYTVTSVTETSTAS
jgi:Tfp pilus assembly protein PilX